MAGISFRSKVYKALETAEKGDRLSFTIDVAIVVLIVINIISVVLESVDAIHLRFSTLFEVIEIISVIVFTAEYVLRLWACPEAPLEEGGDPNKNRYFKHMLSPMAIIDLLAILPFYLTYIFAMDLRFLRVLRLLRILKLTRYSSAMTMLMDVFKEEASAFFAGFFILMVLLVLAASGAYLAEHQTQPDKFGSIPAAMWWSMATLTTVGYGDVTPVTVAGKIFGACVTVVGIGMAALPAGILANGLAVQLNRKREVLTETFRTALEDGIIDANEEESIEDLRKELGLNQSVAQSIRETVQKSKKKADIHFCPHCGGDIEQYKQDDN